MVHRKMVQLNKNGERNGRHKQFKQRQISKIKCV